MSIKIYTDGACKGNPGDGGWGALIIYPDNEEEIFGYEENTTNNRMELLAAIKALEAVTGKKVVKFIENIQVVINRVSSLLNVSTENLVERVNSLLDEKKRLEQKNTELNRALISGEGEQDNQNLEKIGKDILATI